MSAPDVRIDAVFFDLGNVLINFDARRSAMAFARKARVNVMKAFSHFFLSEDEKAYTRGQISSREFFERARKALNTDIDFETFKHYWNDIFWENEGMDELLSVLKKDFPLYLISNTNELHFDHICENYTILRHFNRTFPSHEVGARKPDAEIYEKVLAAVKIEPAHAVFIDDQKDFIRGAQAVGMHGIVFKNRAQLIEDLKKLNIDLSQRLSDV